LCCHLSQIFLLGNLAYCCLSLFLALLLLMKTLPYVVRWSLRTNLLWHFVWIASNPISRLGTLKMKMKLHSDAVSLSDFLIHRLFLGILLLLYQCRWSNQLSHEFHWPMLLYAWALWYYNYFWLCLLFVSFTIISPIYSRVNSYYTYDYMEIYHILVENA